MTSYEALKQQYMNGWQTWNNASVLSHVMMPEGVGLALGLKDYKRAKLLDTALIGQTEEEGIVTPYAHAYDNSFTEVKLDWLENSINVKTALDGDDLVLLVTPLQQPMKCSSLIINGISLWNKGATVEKEGETLLLKGGSKQIPVYMTAPHNGELFVRCTTPFLSADLSGAVGISTGRPRTVEEIEAVIKRQQEKWAANKDKYGKLAEAYNAMQTCQAWDTIYNPQEDSPITTVSRIWNNQWGGYVLFCWDTYFAALMQSIDNKELAYCNAIAITRTITDAGFVPNYACQNNFKSFDRSQPPVGSMVALMMYKKYGDKWFLEELYDDLITWNQWFIDHRSTKNGLLAWGSDPYDMVTGHDLEKFGVHERLGAAYESGLDNSPMYDDIPFDEKRNIIVLEDVGLVGMYIKDCYCLAEIAEILGHTEKTAELKARAETMEERMESLWDEDFGMYLNRREDTGEFEYRLSPFHFHALFSQKVGQKRARRMIDEHFYNEKEFWGEYIIPSIARNDPAYPEQTYWRGRIWAPMNFLAYMAICNYDCPDARKDLAEKSEKLILKEWLEKGHVHENYDGDTGEGCNSSRSDKFYHWGGLLSFIALYENGYYQ
ncbi:MAG: MGH1-like glycoside hydrolase domain-containing protein [Oscillospiraceae bacterium]|jgi:putative isomerase